MRFLVVGTGKLARFRAKKLVGHARASWVGIASRDENRAARAAALVGAHASGTLDELLSSDPNAVVISSASADHRAHLDACIPHGVPILCEKPIALTVDESEEFVRTAQQAGAILQVGFQRRFDAGFASLRERIKAGELGDLYALRLVSHDRTPPSQASLDGKGSIFRDLHVHDFDLARWLTGREVSDVVAVGSCRTEFNYLADAGDADTTAIVLRMDNGMLVTITGSRHSPAGYDVRAEAFGSSGAVAVGVDAKLTVELPGPQGFARSHERHSDFLERFEAAFAAETYAFVDVVTGDRRNPCPGSEGVEALRVAATAEQSWRDGGWVSMPRSKRS